MFCLVVLVNPKVQTCVLGAQKNRFIDSSFEYPQHMFCENKKINSKLRLSISGVSVS